MNYINVIKRELEVAWDDRKLVVVTWVPFGEDPNERPRATVYEYIKSERARDVLVVTPLSNTWADTREQSNDSATILTEVRDYAIEKIVDDEDW